MPKSDRDVRIEFNPNRPKGRVRYSLAHEIAHTLFPDCAEQVRDRGRHQDMRGDEWQLEALCNVGAAEILMPFGSLSKELTEEPRLQDLLKAQQVYGVSTEALLIRVVRLGDIPRAMFCASRLESGHYAGRYRVDYAIGSRSWPLKITRSLLPETTHLAECTAIGFTTAGVEHWQQDVNLEAVAVPPYPGSRFPRVVGVLSESETESSATDRSAELCLTVVKGNALQPRGAGQRFVVQVVNDRTPNWGGAGFAQAVRVAWPEVQADFKDWVEQRPKALQLGNARIANLPGGISVASIIAQKSYGESASPRLRYAALRQGLETVAAVARKAGATVHMPRIGTGHGGGDWRVIEDIVKSTVCDAGLTVTVYELPGQTSTSRIPEQTALSL
ncbi:MAG: ImmA/IrrE family metallo-endopeptidase [Gemmatimonadaceae bacterium]